MVTVEYCYCITFGKGLHRRQTVYRSLMKEDAKWIWALAEKLAKTLNMDVVSITEITTSCVDVEKPT